MRRFLARTAGAARSVGGGAVLAVLVTTPLAAQLKSLPVYGDGATAGLWAVWLDAGSGLNNASGQAHHFGARASGGVGRLTLSAGAGLWDTGSGASATVGGTAGVRLLGGAASPLALALLAGAGYARAGRDSALTTYVTVPVGLVVTFNHVHAAGRTIVPWVAPRGELDRVRFPAVRGGQGGLGLSAGVRAPVSGRIGVHAALDWLELFQRSEGGITFLGGSRVTAGLGVHVLLARPSSGR